MNEILLSRAKCQMTVNKEYHRPYFLQRLARVFSRFKINSQAQKQVVLDDDSAAACVRGGVDFSLTALIAFNFLLFSECAEKDICFQKRRHKKIIRSTI